ncbi:alpha/beta hydrolase [Robertkochia flava]|uniref:alpha/beta hydrolase n=1 Tax=Robertkochia flava TaxID=3447986 RepID=UPI001CC9FCC2|nr:alpha/beta hydrolase [Robertkochia marina]
MRSFKSIQLLTILFFSIAINAQEAATEKYKVTRDVLWATPGNTELHMDIYSPEENDNRLPVLIIYHGGGWLINTKSIMDEMSEYIAGTGKYVVCNVDYRLLTANNNTTPMNAIIEDAMGAVLWVKENIRDYGGDPEQIAVTGDSAGGQLAAMVMQGQELLGACGLSASQICFKPTYMPEGVVVETVKKENLLAVQAAVISYPATDLLAACSGNGPGTGFESASNFFWEMGNGKPRGIFGDSLNAKDHSSLYKKVSPIYTIPEERKLPPIFCHVGEEDNTTPPAAVGAYVNSLRERGADVLYKVYPDQPHAYLDSGSNEFLGTSFENNAIGPIRDIISFLDNVFYQATGSEKE